jgi:hypothetical protein
MGDNSVHPEVTNPYNRLEEIKKLCDHHIILREVFLANGRALNDQIRSTSVDV